MARIALTQIVEGLQVEYGKPKAPRLAGPWEMILSDNVAYLADDERRLRAFQTLQKTIGTKPEEILSCSDDELLEVTRHGMMPEAVAEKLRKCARVMLDIFEGDLRPVLKLPLAKAKKALQRFPGIGEPGAEKILLFCGAYPALALESNGLRVLLRVGFAKEKKSYSVTYRLVQQAAVDGLDRESAWFIQAHLLLRRHGQEVCKRSMPDCGQCPLADKCDYNRAN